MKASDIQKIEAEAKIKIAFDALQSSSDGVRYRGLYNAAVEAVRDLHLQMIIENTDLCTEDDT